MIRPTGEGSLPPLYSAARNATSHTASSTSTSHGTPHRFSPSTTSPTTISSRRASAARPTGSTAWTSPHSASGAPIPGDRIGPGPASNSGWRRQSHARHLASRTASNRSPSTHPCRGGRRPSVRASVECRLVTSHSGVALSQGVEKSGQSAPALMLRTTCEHPPPTRADCSIRDRAATSPVVA
jgi:hypothetical protein